MEFWIYKMAKVYIVHSVVSSEGIQAQPLYFLVCETNAEGATKHESLMLKCVFFFLVVVNSIFFYS